MFIYYESVCEFSVLSCMTNAHNHSACILNNTCKKPRYESENLLKVHFVIHPMRRFRRMIVIPVECAHHLRKKSFMAFKCYYCNSVTRFLWQTAAHLRSYSCLHPAVFIWYHYIKSIKKNSFQFLFSFRSRSGWYNLTEANIDYIFQLFDDMHSRFYFI